MLKKGNIVRVFEDPITREIEEGLGRLVEFVCMEETGLLVLETWMVDFDDGYGPLRRVVQEKDFIGE